MEANLWSDEQKSHQAIVKDKVARQTEVQCKYVDEAVEITYTNAGTRDAFRLYHFDVQFSGSDYVNNGNWLAEKEFLEKHGSELVFFPYTEQTSSSKIKRLIEEKLM